MKNRRSVAMNTVPPFGVIPDPKACNLRRIKRWDSADKITRALLIFVWILKLFICALFLVACLSSVAAILSPIPLIIGLKVFASPPFGRRFE